MSRAEPSTLKPEIVDGSILQDRTLHENAAHHGRFNIQSGTLHALGLNHGQFDVNRTNLPRGDSISRTVPFSKTEPSTKTPRIMEGSASRAEPSALKPEIVEGSIPQARTLHENAAHHGRFSIQSGTIHAEARNRGRFHFPGPNLPRFRPESRTVRCKQNQPSTRRLDITDGPCLRTTFHVNAPFRGRFHSPGPNPPRKRPASWKVHHPERNHPR